MAEIANKLDSVTDILSFLTMLWTVQSLEVLSSTQRLTTDVFRDETLKFLFYG